MATREGAKPSYPLHLSQADIIAAPVAGGADPPRRTFYVGDR
ncbi:MAG: hypothetical protein ABSH01_02875 [Terriglobia bacterium]